MTSSNFRYMRSHPVLYLRARIDADEIGDLVDGLHGRAERMRDEATVQNTMIHNLESHIDQVQEKLDGVSGSLEETLKSLRGSDFSKALSSPRHVQSSCF